MARQYTKDWERRYREGNTPWEDDVPTSEMCQAMLHFLPPPARVFEAGCGLGSNARWLSEQGYRYHGVDISPTAIDQARDMARTQKLRASFEVGDILNYHSDERYDVVLDKGCLHTFLREKDRARFVATMANLLQPDGFWVCVAGNADHPDAPGEAKRYGYPRMSACEIIATVEPEFEIHYLARCRYGTRTDMTDFLGWCCVFQRRAKRAIPRAR